MAACLDDQSRKCNALYNNLLERANELRQSFIDTGNTEHARTLYSRRGLRNLVPAIKETYPYLKSVYAAPLKNTALRLTASITAYQHSKKGKRAGKATGWPTFRSWKGSWLSLLYDEPHTGYSLTIGSYEGKSRAVREVYYFSNVWGKIPFSGIRGISRMTDFFSVS